MPEVSRPHRRLPWALLIGGSLTVFFMGLAIVGPQLAPHDPLATLPAIKVNGHWIYAPFPALTVPAYPLGSDAYGRDTLSQLLWGLRPTLVIVIFVAALRLGLGILIGMISGWTNRLIGRGLRLFTEGALTVPALLVALAVNAALGTQLGWAAFMLGLLLTGWAETARLVRDQTRFIKQQPFIEAARALGATGPQILGRHVLRHILALVWMLWAFEISGALLLTAELGFFGYYLGGGTWIQTGDWSARNVTGLPELGQLLAAAYSIMLLYPEGMFATGTLIFLIILGFNLLGEGLRRQLSLETQRTAALTVLTTRLQTWLAETVWPWASQWARRHWGWLIGVGGLAGVGLGVTIWLMASAPASVIPTQPLVIPGQHWWAAERRDAFGTLWTTATGPTTSRTAWTFTADGSWAGGPAIAADGTLYAATVNQTVYALQPDGTVKWTFALDAPAVGTPALDAAGNVYIVDQPGKLWALSPQGQLRWQFQMPMDVEATSGPVVAADGKIFFALGNMLQAVTPEGSGLWRGTIATYAQALPRLSADEQTVLYKDTIFRTSNGTPRRLRLSTPDNLQLLNAEHFVGGDGRAYFFYGHILLPWKFVPEGALTDPALTWNYEGQELHYPTDAGVTGEGAAWLEYATGYSLARLVWLDTRTGRVLSNVRFTHFRSRVIAVTPGNILYTCDPGECLAYRAGSGVPVAQIPLDNRQPLAGGALAPGRLYLTTQAGVLFAIGP